jgi:hypothetical protein
VSDTTTASPTSGETTTATPSTSAPTTTSAPRGNRPGKGSTTTEAPTTTAATTTTTTIPIAERPTYACASGATVIGLPDSSTATWTVLVRQPGLADRELVVVQAYR